MSETRGTSGFTLMELLISLALLSLLSLLLVNGLRFGARVWERGDRATGSSGDVSIVHDFLARRLKSAIFADSLDSNGKELPSVFGNNASLSFLTTDPDNAALAARHRLTIDCDPATRGACEVAISAVDGKPLPWLETEQSRSTLLSGLSAIEITYLGRDRKGDEPIWHNSWQSSKMTPSLVRVSFELDSQRHFQWTFALP